jgi:hypothetical protein
MEWLRSSGCNITLVNHNGHGALHKAAQRGQREICEWFFASVIDGLSDTSAAMQLVGPDTEGYCPSDLAGVAHESLAEWIATREMNLVRERQPDELAENERKSIPEWLTAPLNNTISMRISDKELYIWEQYGGVRRMRSILTTR